MKKFSVMALIFIMVMISSAMRPLKAMTLTAMPIQRISSLNLNMMGQTGLSVLLKLSMAVL